MSSPRAGPVPISAIFKSVAVIEVLVAPGDRVEVDTPLVTLETDKATMDVPSTAAGKSPRCWCKKGARIAKGTPLVRLRTAGTEAAPASTPALAAVSARAPQPGRPPPPRQRPAPPAVRVEAAVQEPPTTHTTQLLVLGAGPGGYTAAFRAADLGLSVTLVERWEQLGGVCLNVGCIPSKALLHAAKVIEDAHAMRENGIVFGEPQLDFDRLRAWKNGVVRKLTGGLATLARQRRVQVRARYGQIHQSACRAGQRRGRRR